MAFPTTTVLDDGTGADFDPLSAAWTTPMFSAGENTFEHFQNSLAPSAGPASAFWDASFGPDSEVYYTCTMFQHVGSIRLFLRLTGGGGAVGSASFYRFLLDITSGDENGGTFDLYLHSYVTGAPTELAAEIGVTMTAGDSVGFEAIGTTITGYHKPAAGSWTPVIQAVDSTVPNSGNIGFYSDSSAARFNDFGGGTAVATSGRNYKRFYGPEQLASSATTLFTVPSRTKYELRQIFANNPSGSAVDVTLSIGADGAATRIVDEASIPAGEALNMRRLAHHVLEAGEVLQGFASSAATVVLTVDGVEYGL